LGVQAPVQNSNRYYGISETDEVTNLKFGRNIHRVHPRKAH